MKVTAIGIDLAKNVFQVHGVDEHGKVILEGSCGVRSWRFSPSELRAWWEWKLMVARMNGRAG